MPRFSPSRASTSAVPIGDGHARGRPANALASGGSQRERSRPTGQARQVDRRGSRPSAWASPGEVIARSLRFAGLRRYAGGDSPVAERVERPFDCLLVRHVLHSVWPRFRRDSEARAGTIPAGPPTLSHSPGPTAKGTGCGQGTLTRRQRWAFPRRLAKPFRERKFSTCPSDGT